MKNLIKKARTKNGLLLFGIGVLSFLIMLAAATMTIAIMNVLLANAEFDAFTISFIALTAFALLFTVAVVVMLYIMTQKSQVLIDSLNRVASGDFSTEITYKRGDTFSGVYKNFNKMIKELNSVKIMRDEFVHDFSHEIKTPLFSIQGFANLLLEGGLSEEEQKKLLTIISEEAGRLFRIADNTLILAKLENQQFLGERTVLKLDAEINDCIILLEKEWVEKNIEVSSDLSPVKIEGDGAMLRQVWLNLLSNAVKFTPEGGKIEVACRQNADKVEIDFKDSGCGISPEDMPHIFDKYYRSDSSAESEGNGLGLAICKRICSIMGGDISVKSTVGEGSVFTVTLPAVSA